MPRPRLSRLHSTRPRWILCLLVVCALAGLQGCGALGVSRDDPPAWPELRERELGSMLNVHSCGHLWFGGAPTRADLDLAARRGVKVLVHAGTPEEELDYDWREVATKLELTIVDLELSGDVIEDASIDRFLALFDTTEDPPGTDVLLFCGNGQRSAIFFAVYRVVHCGVPLEDAVREARRAGMKPGAPEVFVRQQVLRLRPDSARVQEDRSAAAQRGA